MNISFLNGLGIEAGQALILLIILATMAMFLWGKWRHDMVALGALLACVFAGIVPGEEAFDGFGHPAVITVACILVLSKGLQLSGAVDMLTNLILPKSAGVFISMTVLIGLGAFLSSFMNNVGAMALLMPVAIQMSGRLNISAGQVLMPLAFGTILGGMTTLIGTPPNLIVAGFRAQSGVDPFGFFDFTPVGLSVAVVGIIFVVLFSRLLVPANRTGDIEGFETGAYFTEVRITEKSNIAGKTLYQIESELEESDAQIIALIRNTVRINAPSGSRKVKGGDILVIEAPLESLTNFITKTGVTLEEQGSSKEEPGKDLPHPPKDTETEVTKEENEIVFREYVVRSESELVGRSAKDMLLRSRFSLNLLAISRDGKRSQARLRTIKLRSGDLLLMQGPADGLAAFANDMGCIPLAARSVRIPDKKMAYLSMGIMAAAILLITVGFLNAAVAFALGVLASMVLRTVPPSMVYQAIDWPVIVLLGALIPVATAMETTGAAVLISEFLVENLAQGNAIIGLIIVMIVTMCLSDVMNNAATAAVMCPIAIGIATTLGVNADSYLMAVAIGASCAFLTPIGHQNNTLILGPGGFKFGDYWRLGLPLEALIVIVSIPLLLIVWPL